MPESKKDDEETKSSRWTYDGAEEKDWAHSLTSQHCVHTLNAADDQENSSEEHSNLDSSAAP